MAATFKLLFVEHEGASPFNANVEQYKVGMFCLQERKAEKTRVAREAMGRVRTGNFLDGYMVNDTGKKSYLAGYDHMLVITPPLPKVVCGRLEGKLLSQAWRDERCVNVAQDGGEGMRQNDPEMLDKVSKTAVCYVVWRGKVESVQLGNELGGEAAAGEGALAKPAASLKRPAPASAEDPALGGAALGGPSRSGGLSGGGGDGGGGGGGGPSGGGGGKRKRAPAAAPVVAPAELAPAPAERPGSSFVGVSWIPGATGKGTWRMMATNPATKTQQSESFSSEKAAAERWDELNRSWGKTQLNFPCAGESQAKKPKPKAPTAK